jgi:hypothetical protein
VVKRRPVGKRLLAAGGLASLILAGSLTGCSNGVEAGTLDSQSSTGVERDLGALRIRNAVIVSGAAGGLTVSLTVVNTGTTEDAITDVEVSGDAEPVSADLSPRSIALAPKTATVIPGETRPRIQVDLDIVPGSYTSVTLHFASAGTVTLSLPVINEDSAYGGSSA